ncbi:MAG: hypothetical protein AAF236_10175 [Verrucomicrobiota bacterium]
MNEIPSASQPQRARPYLHLVLVFLPVFSILLAWVSSGFGIWSFGLKNYRMLAGLSAEAGSLSFTFSNWGGSRDLGDLESWSSFLPYLSEDELQSREANPFSPAARPYPPAREIVWGTFGVESNNRYSFLTLPFWSLALLTLLAQITLKVRRHFPR